MSQPDLQLGGGYTYQWRCAILLALNYLHEPVAYNQALHELVTGFLGAVDAIHLEGEKIGSARTRAKSSRRTSTCSAAARTARVSARS